MISTGNFYIGTRVRYPTMEKLSFLNFSEGNLYNLKKSKFLLNSGPMQCQIANFDIGIA